ncbi:MAG: hypothetical protein QXT26_05930 [Thermoproteota archaeon]
MPKAIVTRMITPDMIPDGAISTRHISDGSVTRLKFQHSGIVFNTNLHSTSITNRAMSWVFPVVAPKPIRMKYATCNISQIIDGDRTTSYDPGLGASGSAVIDLGYLIEAPFTVMFGVSSIYSTTGTHRRDIQISYSIDGTTYTQIVLLQQPDVGTYGPYIVNDNCRYVKVDWLEISGLPSASHRVRCFINEVEIY